MRQLIRIAQPKKLEENWEKWGKRYFENKSANNSYLFKWNIINGIKSNHLLAPILLKMSDNHCHYCDKFPLLHGDLTIDHFKPKSKPEFYSIAYKWENLYLSCNHCQRCKMEQYDSCLLSPDEFNYSFRFFFIYNYSTHELEINPQISPKDHSKAEITLSIFNFNHPSLTTSRRHAFERFIASSSPDIQDDPFRFIFE